jgi:hypothetical protein
VTLRRVIAVLGACEAAVLLAHASLSYAEAPVVSFASRPPEQQAFYAALAARVAPAGSALARWMSGNGPTAAPDTFLLLYAAPVLLATMVALAALYALRRPDRLDEDTPRALLRWAWVFALVMAPAAPVMVTDFWLSVAWGRTLWWGGNPYYDVPAAASIGLPMDRVTMHMTYGPLWAHLSWLVTALARGSVLWSAVLFKLVLGSAWCATLWLIERLMRRRAIVERCAAIVIVGWLPIGVVQSVGDGHNDVMMVLGVIAWLFLLERGDRRWATVALALSVAAKYVSAPLFLLDLLHVHDAMGSRPSIARRVRDYVPRALIAALTVALTFAPVFRSLRFFATTAEVNQGHFFIPGGAALALGELLHLPAMPAAIALQLIFPVVAALALWRYLRAPGATTFRIAAAAVMMVVLLDVAGHVWPWYVLWFLAPAALVPASGIGRWATGIALAAPFPLLVWITYPQTAPLGRYHLPALAMYGFALLWLLALSRRVAPAFGATPGQAGEPLATPGAAVSAAGLSARRS